VVIQTKGDANNARDQWHAHLIGNTVWHEDFKLPKFGYLAVWSQQRLVRFGLLVVIVILILSMQLGWIWRPSPGPVRRPRSMPGTASRARPRRPRRAPGR
jgi:hypothetical protein